MRPMFANSSAVQKRSENSPLLNDHIMRCPAVTPAIGPSGLFSAVVFRIAQRLILKPAVDRNRRSHAGPESIARIHDGDHSAIKVTLRHVRIPLYWQGAHAPSVSG